MNLAVRDIRHNLGSFALAVAGNYLSWIVAGEWQLESGIARDGGAYYFLP